MAGRVQVQAASSLGPYGKLYGMDGPHRIMEQSAAKWRAQQAFQGSSNGCDAKQYYQSNSYRVLKSDAEANESSQDVESWEQGDYQEDEANGYHESDVAEEEHEGEVEEEEDSEEGESEEEEDESHQKLAEEPGAPYGFEDDGTVLLVKHTRVIVKGNNRTKPGMVGMRGCIKKSIGLGGWHYVRLETGKDVKLQRNALTVVAPPTGNEPDFSDEDDEPIVRKRKAKDSDGPRRPASRRSSGTSKRQAINSRVDFAKLDVISLRKYRKINRLAVAPNVSKETLIAAVARHFTNSNIDEGLALRKFYRAVQRHSD